jgi:diguanylate cyclase (GGDEF)-like protein
MGRTEKIIGLLQVNSSGRAVWLTALVTVFAASACVCAVSLALPALAPLPRDAVTVILAVAALIPLVLTPPLAFALLSALRLFSHALDGLGRQARIDAVTGAYRRAPFIEKAGLMMEDGGALLLIDADHIARVKSEHGREVAGEALRKFALALRAATPRASLIGRLSPDGFAVFMPRARMAEAEAAALRVSAAVCNLCHTIAGREIHLTATIGGADGAPDMDFAALMRLAGERLYAAKCEGRARTVLVDAPPLAPDFSEFDLWEADASHNLTSAAG